LVRLRLVVDDFYWYVLRENIRLITPDDTDRSFIVTNIAEGPTPGFDLLDRRLSVLDTERPSMGQLYKISVTNCEVDLNSLVTNLFLNLFMNESTVQFC